MRVLIQAFLMLGLAQGNAFAELVDPTKPPPAVLEYLPNAESQAEKPWVLTAIQHNGKSGFAVVNGQMVQVGESYSGFKLTSVKNQQAVFISSTGEKKVIGLGLTSYIVEAQPQVKTKAKTSRHTGKVKK
ncbi:MAG: hypothetical protein ACTS9Y_03665 [Methylophilus sp.]|uniref:hypothetical protein n=1 Tax=Methylophilus sp. TaxID=29541 RepID=UPI003FA0F370